MVKPIGWPILAVGLVALWGAALAAAPTPITAKAETRHYRLELDIGGMERMYTKAEAAKLHPKGGEIMVSGTMAGMPMGSGETMPPMGKDKSAKMQMPAPAPSAAGPWRHLEVHVISKATGKPLRAAKVRIVVTNTQNKRRTVVPVAVMYGIREGLPDWHYGNNVILPAGAYRIDVAANGEKAAFEVSVPAF